MVKHESWNSRVTRLAAGGRARMWSVPARLEVYLSGDQRRAGLEMYHSGERNGGTQERRRLRTVSHLSEVSARLVSSNKWKSKLTGLFAAQNNSTALESPLGICTNPLRSSEILRDPQRWQTNKPTDGNSRPMGGATPATVVIITHLTERRSGKQRDKQT